MFANGTVKWFNPRKGYGFIVAEQGAAEVFVHYSEIVADEGFRKLLPGDRVEFDMVDGAKGLYASNVRKSIV